MEKTMAMEFRKSQDLSFWSGPMESGTLLGKATLRLVIQYLCKSSCQKEHKIAFFCRRCCLGPIFGERLDFSSGCFLNPNWHLC